MIFGSQVRRQQPHRGNVDRAVRKQVQDHREPACAPGDLDAVVSLPFRQSQDVAAIHEEGREALSEVDLTSIQLGQVRDELGRGIAFTGDEPFHPRDEFLSG